jgi:hypothetical protein
MSALKSQIDKTTWVIPTSDSRLVEASPGLAHRTDGRRHDVCAPLMAKWSRYTSGSLQAQQGN